ncbi:hypothetical protein CMQ_5884 [Grosmannia clavigera kw1407]|uniref:RGS domain-containing protein n=1 Tax=Grosmannia clavigera (strain kw1407 / UAMH 11150) TaxID=655863 RepID=F0XID5_GROCL|nr:uncharacterized protein CMQ_5884 [Grosmannia clavigera kw1407]EFX02523.1 hypothetical protein CMQ_5884 [Grosmannia clavigera kw1407]
MRFPSWLSWYKKLEYRDIKEYSNAVVSGKRDLSPDGRGKTAVPARLRLERVLQNKTCSPMSLYDFYMYLKYIEFSPENLEFYIWYKSYEEGWKKNLCGDFDAASLSSSVTSTASLRKATENPSEVFSTDPEIGKSSVPSPAICLQLLTVQPRLLRASRPPSSSSRQAKTGATLNVVDASAGRRAELGAVIKIFLRPGAEKELNIPPAMRDHALAELQSSADPTHLKAVADHVYLLLRNCSHRNFVRLGVSNGTIETICVATGLGIALTIAGVLCVLLRALTPHVGVHSRFDVFAAWPMWWLGLSLILSGLRGSCFFLLLFTHRQPLPWERFDDSASMLSHRSGFMKRISRLMIFDRKLRVADTHLRRLQHRIVVQSLLFGAFFAFIGVLIFIFLPIWSETV